MTTLTKADAEAVISQLRASISTAYRMIERVRAAAGIEHYRAVVGEMEQIAEAVATETGISVALMKGPSRSKSIFYARAEAMRRIRETGRYSTPQIGRFFGGRDHASVLNAIKQAEIRKQLAE